MLGNEVKQMKVLHYINQFFGQLGGEDSAYAPLEVRSGTVGPGKVLQSMLKDCEIVATAVCGDNYFVENTEQLEKEIADALDEYEIDLVIAGPGFNAGRYGMACGGVCKIAFEKGLPAVSALYEENPGLDLYRKYGYIFPADKQARGMKPALEKIAAFVNKIAEGGEIGLPEEEGYYVRGIRRPAWREKTGAQRAVDMAVAKALGQPFKTEVEMPVFDHIVPSEPVADLSKATVALITSGGIVPKGNPDHLEALSASKWVAYTKDSFGGDFGNIQAEVAHGGYDPAYGNENGNRVLPADAMEELERRGVIGKFYDKMLVTVGNCMDIKKATKYGKEMAEQLKNDGVDAVLLTST